MDTNKTRGGIQAPASVTSSPMPTPADIAHANEYFEYFLTATSLKNILGAYRSICDLLKLRPNQLPLFYPKLRQYLCGWKAKALWKRFDAKAQLKCYGKGKLCPGTRVLVIGGGPCGLRTAIEAQLLGAKVVVIEKRDRFSRNNVLHLWPFVIEDLRSLGAKKFFGKFCAGSIDHISIRQIQYILFKVCLLLGVELHTEVSFERLIEPIPDEKTGWRGEFVPPCHPVSQYQFDVVIGADGKRNTLEGFSRKEFRGKLAIAITANFINKKTEAEAMVEEISGVAFIFNQKFFKDLHEQTGIDLENIVYYKDETHYFVMTAKKASLIEKGVIIQDLADTERLLAPDNVNREALMSYAREAAEFSTKYQMHDLEFAVNHYGLADVAMFDFTSMYAAENASKVIERHGYRLLMILVGDSLLEPFWPTGSGCARGFLSSMDAGWAIRSWASPNTTPLEVIAERESIYRLLAQTTPDNLNKDWKAYTIDPATRYPNLNKGLLVPQQVVAYYDTDDPRSIESMKRKDEEQVGEVPKKRRRGNVDNEILLNWISDQIRGHEDIQLNDIASVFRDGKVLCCIINHYRPDLVDYNSIKDDSAIKNNQLALDILEKEMGIPPIMTGEEITTTSDFLSMATYLTQIYDVFRGEIPHIKHPKLKSYKTREKNSKVPENFQTSSTVKTGKSIITIYDTKKSRSKEQNSKSSKCGLIDLGKFKIKENKETVITIKKSSRSSKKLQVTSKALPVCEKSFRLKYFDENFNEVSPEFPVIETPSMNHFSHKTLLNKSKESDFTSKKSTTKSEESVPVFDEDLQMNSEAIQSSNRNHVDIIPCKISKINLENDVRQSIDSEMFNRSKMCGSKKSVSVFTIYNKDQKENKIYSQNNESTILIRVMEKKCCSQKCLVQDIRYDPLENSLIIFSKTSCRMKETNNFVNKSSGGYRKYLKGKKCQIRLNEIQRDVKFLSFNMSESEDNQTVFNEQVYSRVSNWICSHDFDGLLDAKEKEPLQNETNVKDENSDNVSESRCAENGKHKKYQAANDLCSSVPGKEHGDGVCLNGFASGNRNTVRTSSEFSNCSQFEYNPNEISQGEQFSVIWEGDESELPDNKASKLNILTKPLKPSTFALHAQPVNRHKRAAPEQAAVAKSSGRDGRPRKRRTGGLEKSGVSVEERQKVLEEIAANRSERINKRRQQRKLQTEQFMKSMQMLQVNAKPDKSQPFEDYSIYLYRQNAPNFEDRVKDLQKQFIYVPDPEQKPPSMQHRGSVTDEDLAARIRSLEDKWRDPEPTERKPKDLMRAIGKIETSDWNIREIEKKIQENRSAKVGGKDREKVPKWSKEEFLARQNRMENKHLDRQDSREAKYADIDKNIKHLELKLKEGTSRDLGQNKVASITEKLVNKQPDEPKPIEKSNSKTVVMPQSTSDLCHFCDKRVYLMERLSAEGRFFHHSCFKCQYCHAQLKLGSYAFDREGLYGFKFYCVHHFGMLGEAPVTKVTHKTSGRGPRDVRSPEKRQIQVTGVDLLDRVQTPERIEFANLSTGIPSSDQEESLSQMDEDEWTDKNFGASAAEFGSSDDESSSLSETESDDEDAYEEALDEPVTKEGTMKWAELLKKRYPKKRRNSNDSSSTDHSSYYENSSDDDDSDTATEGEEEIRAREIRKQEVRVEPPVVQTDTGTDTEVVSEEETSSSSEIHNSATEISTDSEFAQDDPTPTREIPSILLNDFHVTKTRGSSSHQRERDHHVRKSRKSALQPKKIQVTSSFLQSPSSNGRAPKPDIELKLTPLVPSAPIIRKPALLPRTEGYALNRTQSTGGIAAKVSLELKKKYLLGESAVPGSIQKSGSSSVLDTKLKSFHSNISDCQKLLKPASEVSASMKTFCSKLDERVSPILSPQSSNTVLNKSDEIIKPKTEPLPPPDVIKVETPVFENENHGRPRSPVHETSIIVPEIDWSKKGGQMSEDSLSESTSEVEDAKTPEFKYEPIPRVEIHAVEDLDENKADDIPPDSLCIEAETKPVQDDQHVLNNEPPKSSINSDKKSLNQPKCLPAVQKESIFSEIHFSLHKTHKASNQNSEKQSPEDLKSVKNSSGRSTPSNADSCAEQMTAAFTETELSDWARDDEVSDDLECVEYELNEDVQKPSANKKSKLPNVKSDATLADRGEPKDIKQICDKTGTGKDFKELKNKTIITEAMNNLLSSNLDNIEFMDTGTETSSDDGIVDERNGYVLFNNEDDIMEDSLNPNINSVAETRNTRVCNKYDKPLNTGYCIFDIQDNFGSEVIELKPSDLEKLKQKQNHLEAEEDSLLIVEPGTTTEENTCSDSTVKFSTNIRTADGNGEKSQAVRNENLENFKSTDIEVEEKHNEMKEEKSIEIEHNQNRETNSQKQRLEEKLAKLKAEKAIQKQNKELSSHKENLNNETGNLEFQEHCQRLQSKIEFGNARDSIDIRKTRRKSKTEIVQRPDLIQEEKEKSSPVHSSKDITLNLTPVIRTQNTFYKKECIEKERDVNQKLIQEMVMNKMRAENKSLERKKRNRSTPSPLKPFELTRSATADVVLQDSDATSSINSTSTSTIPASLNKYATPDVLLNTNAAPLQKSQTSVSVSKFEKSTSPIKEQYVKPLSVYSSLSDRSYNDKCTEQMRGKMQNNEYITNAESLKTPNTSATSRQRIEATKKTTEKLREDARTRMRMLSNEELGLSPEDRLEKLREKMGIQKDQVSGLQEHLEPLVISSEKRHSWLYSNDTLKKKKNNSFRRSKSGDDGDKRVFRQLSFLKSSDNLITGGKDQTPEKSEVRKMCKSDPNLLDTEEKKSKKKPKDRERKKSITTIISGLFTSKKSPSGSGSGSGSGSRRLFSRISPKSKDVSKSCADLATRDPEILREESVRRNSFSEVGSLKENKDIPPPIPPLPLNYVGYLLKDDGSDGEREWKYDRSSCDTLDQSAVLDCSTSSLNSRRSSKGARRARQAQLKRHRLAQEIQRKLEEAEVKTRALEERGVHVEKALRGEGGLKASNMDETHLLQEWFDLMRDRTELRRYERELTVRAQELELEDRHARLQQELRDRMENDVPKTSRDEETERHIINEMMDIVDKRDSLIAVLEEDRLRYSNEDRDFEEQMLAKGLRLTPIIKNP